MNCNQEKTRPHGGEAGPLRRETPPRQMKQVTDNHQGNN